MVSLLLAQAIGGAYAKISNYSNPADDFEPTEEHKQAHKISGEDFERNEEYIRAAAEIPAVLFVLGFVSLIILDILLCICMDKRPTRDGHKFAWVMYYGMSIAALIASLCVYLGYSDVEDGLDKLDKSVVAVQDAFDVLATDGDELEKNYDTMETNCESSPACCGYTDIAARLDDFYSAWESYDEDTSAMIDSADDVIDYMDSYSQYAVQFTLVIFLFVFVSMVLSVSAGLCRSRRGVGCASCCGSISFLVVMLVGAIFMLLTAITGDICYDDPTLTILNTAPSGNAQAYMVWYSTCGATGENALFDYTASLTNSTNAILTDIETAQADHAECNTESEFLAIEVAALAALDNIDQIVKDASCKDVQDAWFTAVNDGICGSLFSGLLTCWLIALISTILIFSLQIPATTIAGALSSFTTVRPVDFDSEPPPAAAQQQQVSYKEADEMMVPAPPPAKGEERLMDMSDDSYNQRRSY